MVGGTVSYLFFSQDDTSDTEDSLGSNPGGSGLNKGRGRVRALPVAPVNIGTMVVNVPLSLQNGDGDILEQGMRNLGYNREVVDLCMQNRALNSSITIVDQICHTGRQLRSKSYDFGGTQTR